MYPTTRTGDTKANCIPIYGRQFVTVVPEDWAHRHISCCWFDSTTPWMVVLPCPPRSPDFVPGDLISFRTQVTSYRAVTSALLWRLKLFQDCGARGRTAWLPAEICTCRLILLYRQMRLKWLLYRGIRDCSWDTLKLSYGPL